MSQKPRHALLDTLFAAQRENQIDENGIQEEVDTFVFAGYDTVSAAIVHSLLVLANYREVQKTLYDHIQEALGMLYYLTLFYSNKLHISFHRKQQQ